MRQTRLRSLLLSATGLVALAATQNYSQTAQAKQPAPEEEAEPSEEAPTDESGEAETPAPEAPATDDLASLRAEYLKLRDRLFQSRARSAAVASALYSTRLSLHLKYDSARFYTVTRASIRLDGANVYDDSEGKIASSAGPRFEGFIAPGRHQVVIRIEATGKDDDRFTSAIESSFVVQAEKDKDLVIKARAEDEGNMAYAWEKKQKGSYKLHLDVDVKTQKRDAKDSGHIQRTGSLDSRDKASKTRS